MKTTDYKTAVNWLHNSLILCNNIPEIDSETFWDECRFDLYDENENPTDIYQYFITDCSLSDVEYLEKHFGLLFSYSTTLDCYILCVDHYGTMWSGVPCETDLENAPELKY